VDLEQPSGVGIGAQMALDRPAHARFMAPARCGPKRPAHRAPGRAVVELDRAADVDAARLDLDRTCFIQLANSARTRGRPRARAWRGRTPPARSGWYSRITEICSSSREPKWANTPDLLMCVASQRANRPARRCSSPPARSAWPGPARRRQWRPWSAGPFAERLQDLIPSLSWFGALTTPCRIR
jgi:hypothetical protein